MNSQHLINYAEKIGFVYNGNNVWMMLYSGIEYRLYMSNASIDLFSLTDFDDIYSYLLYGDDKFDAEIYKQALLKLKEVFKHKIRCDLIEELL